MYKWMNIERLLSFDPLQHVVQSDKSSCPAHTSTTVDHHDISVVVWMRLAHTSNEVNQRDGIGWNSVVWPAKVVE